MLLVLGMVWASQMEVWVVCGNKPEGTSLMLKVFSNSESCNDRMRSYRFKLAERRF